MSIGRTELRTARRAFAIRWIGRLLRDRKGAMAAMMAAAAPILVGAAGVGVEVGLWYMDKRAAQVAADAAASAGTFERIRGTTDQIVAAARQDAARNGFQHGVNATVTVNYPPLTGKHAGNYAAVEAVILQSKQTLLASIVGMSTVDIAARAVAAVSMSGDACVLALDTTASAAVGNKGSANINLAGCTIAANSNSSSAIDLTGSSSVIAESFWTVGNYSSGGSAVITLATQPVTNAWPLDDPYAGLEVPTFAGCTHNNKNYGSGTSTVTPVGGNPVVFCNGLSVGSQATLILNPGVYIIDRGDLNVNAQATLTCNCSGTDGVTIILTSSTTANQIGSVTINGGATVNLTAPSDPSNPYQGVLFYQDRHAPSNKMAKFNGGSSMNLTGAIYFPVQEVEWAGNNGPTSPSCTEIIAKRITFTGASKLEDTACKDMGVEPITVTGVRLVE